MKTNGQTESSTTWTRVFLYGTLISGCIAAYLLYRRGESFATIATKTITNAVGSLVSEVKGTI